MSSINENNRMDYSKYPYFNGYLDYYNNVAMQGGCRCKKSYFRILNAYADKPIDIQVNEILMAEDLKIGGLTKYVKFEPGTYHVKIYDALDSKNLIFETNLKMGRNLAYTGVVTRDDDDPEDISILMVPEEKENSIKGKMSSVRLTNIALNAPEMELVAQDGTVLFSHVAYGDASGNIAIPSGIYTLYLRNINTKNNVLKLPYVDFAPRMHYNLFIAEKEESKDIQLIIPEDGVNYLELC
ncbi:MAG: DUF4397 domain-containing protein [Sedimentibacter saalensis]|uniref:Uncharacterized protein DUF4397 n=1 Tax=Sedimentibacter saalensis TaxID=130788 RepID=A0A562JHV0_9FIRM|nr:DUF4397 domain-containing protein [Sedimentibacter saalensis]MEA5094607.1 DUF4397 domain-containing protein [Sedimentibacter saalensis]TWH82721.1 uncharacterized protein DUF4397 [Sedimentibacter saalensis]